MHRVLVWWPTLAYINSYKVLYIMRPVWRRKPISPYLSLYARTSAVYSGFRIRSVDSSPHPSHQTTDGGTRDGLRVYTSYWMWFAVQFALSFALSVENGNDTNASVDALVSFPTAHGESDASIDSKGNWTPKTPRRRNVRSIRIDRSSSVELPNEDKRHINIERCRY